jgi:dihydroorotate dehydrogenase electron transfer subunit
MRQTQVAIAAMEAVGPYRRIRFDAPDFAPALEPGRAILAALPQAYLRRTWWPCAIDGDGLAVLTQPAQAAGLRTGDRVDVLGPVGRGFRVQDASHNLLLVAAGRSAPDPDLGPLLPLVDRALAAGRSVTLAYAAPSAGQAYPISALPAALEVILAVDADVIALLSEAIAWADQVMACGPSDFAARLAERIDAIRFPAPRSFAQVLRPVELPCGAGACGVCRAGSRLACLDGPVFELAAVRRWP